MINVYRKQTVEYNAVVADVDQYKKDEILKYTKGKQLRNIE